MSKKTVLKIVDGVGETIGRDRRELAVARDLGATVMIMAKGEPEDDGRMEVVEGFDVYRFSTRPLGVRAPVTLNRILTVFIWATKVKRFRPDIISGHNMRALLIGYLSVMFKRKAYRAKLIYDSHEFELGYKMVMNSDGIMELKPGESRIVFFFTRVLEKYLMKRCVCSIMVNDSIADEVQKIHRLKERPMAIRSTPVYWELDYKAISKIRYDFCENLGASALKYYEENSLFLLMFHGHIDSSRSVDDLLKAVALTPDNVHLVILGRCDSSYRTYLLELAKELGIAKRVLLHPAVPYNQLCNYVASADCGLVIYKALCANLFFSLPKKSFENIQSLTPLICADFPEMNRLVNQYKIGITCNPEDPADVANAIAAMMQDKEQYAVFKENLKIAKKELCWEKERERMVEVYKEALGGHTIIDT